MHAVYMNQPGGPEVLQYGPLDDPQAGEGQLLIEVHAVSINPIDTYIRKGANYWPLPQPYIPGADFAGKVIGLGPGAQGWKVGDRVWGSNQGLLGRQGSFAETIAVDASWAYPIPENVPYDAMAAIALVGITAHLGLFREAHLSQGQTLFVRGGTGGVGSMVVQMGHLTGARVITTAGSPEKADQCKALGADDVIEYRKEELSEALKRLAPGGVDLFWETLREPDFELAVAALAPRGTMVLMAGRDAKPPFPVGPFYVKECKLTGFAMFQAPPEVQAQAARQIAQWVAQGRLLPRIDRTLPLSQAHLGHRLQEENTVGKSGALAGKIVLVPDRLMH
jgi:NADPH2:quinone reductase